MDDALDLADDLATLQQDPASPFRICKVLSHVGTSSVTIDYGGTPVPIDSTRIFLEGVFPADNTWVVVGINGTDRFIFARR